MKVPYSCDPQKMPFCVQERPDCRGRRECRLGAVTGLNSGSVSLAYDGLGRLYQTQGSATTQFLYECNQIIAEYSGGSILRRYAPGVGPTETLAWYEGSGTADRRALITDRQGSTIAVANSSGTTNATNTYDEYGMAGSSNLGRFQYAGEPWIPEAGLYNLQARVYSPILGRFIQTDPIG